MRGDEIVAVWTVVSVILFFLLAHYVFLSLAFMTIARKLGFEDAWMAWVPILSWYMLVKLGERPGWWVMLFFVPFVSFIIRIILWMKIAERRGKPEWLGLILLMPFGVWIVPGVLAWAD